MAGPEGRREEEAGTEAAAGGATVVHTQRKILGWNHLGGLNARESQSANRIITNKYYIDNKRIQKNHKIIRSKCL